MVRLVCPWHRSRTLYHHVCFIRRVTKGCCMQPFFMVYDSHTVVDLSLITVELKLRHNFIGNSPHTNHSCNEEGDLDSRR
jgi:hypothetical protein